MNAKGRRNTDTVDMEVIVNCSIRRLHVVGNLNAVILLAGCDGRKPD